MAEGDVRECAGVEPARARAARCGRMLAAHRRAEAEFARKRAVIERMVAGPHTSE